MPRSALSDPLLERPSSEEPRPFYPDEIYRDLPQFKFRQVWSFWYGSSFLMGTLLFIWVPVLEIHGFTVNKTKVNSTFGFTVTKLALLIGSTYFLRGCFAGYHLLINTSEAGPAPTYRRFWVNWPELRKQVGLTSIILTVVYLAGALLFEVQAISDLFLDPPEGLKFLKMHQLPREWESGLVAWPAILGGFLFFVGGICELIENSCLTSLPITVVWWVSVSNCLGGLLFWVSACPSAMKHLEEGVARLDLKIGASKFVGLVGDGFYLIGSLLAIWMWKGENFGLALISVLNKSNKNQVSSLRVPAHEHAELMQQLEADGELEPKLTPRAYAFVVLWIVVGAMQWIMLAGAIARFEGLHGLSRSALEYNEPFWKSVTDILNSVCWVVFVGAIQVYQSAAVMRTREMPYRLLVNVLRIMAPVALAASAVSIFSLFLSFEVQPEAPMGNLTSVINETRINGTDGPLTALQ